jgi:hypothetical protein
MDSSFSLHSIDASLCIFQFLKFVKEFPIVPRAETCSYTLEGTSARVHPHREKGICVRYLNIPGFRQIVDALAEYIQARYKDVRRNSLNNRKKRDNERLAGQIHSVGFNFRRTRQILLCVRPKSLKKKRVWADLVAMYPL